MESNLFKYIWRHSRGDQLVVLLVVLLSMPFYFLSLDLPKSIVNKGIQGDGFQGPGSTRTFLSIDLPFGETLFGEPVHIFGGFELEQSGYLLALSFIFLALVVVNGVFKLKINTMKGRLGERMLRRLRFELADRLLRFPLKELRRVKQAEAATMIKDEVEPLGGFIGDAFITPVFLGGQAITAMVFIVVQSLWLGLVALTIVGLQGWIIPKLRRRIIYLGKERQLTARQLAGRIGEVIDGATEVQANDASNFERADLVSRLGRIFHIRFEIYQRKFFVKFLNNFLSQLTPFIFYVVGGLLALAGELDIGALVAVIGAYKDLPSPIKELIDWDQQRMDVAIKYQQVIEQFQPGELLEAEVQQLMPEPVPALSGPLSLVGIGLNEDDGTKRLDGVSLTLPLDRHLAVVGDSASGKDRLLLVMAALERPSAGSIRVGDADLLRLPQYVTGRRLGYVGQEAYHFPTSVRENLLYGLKHAPLRAADLDEETKRKRAHADHETHRAGNPVFDISADWVDRAALGGEGRDFETKALLEACEAVDLSDDLYRFGLNATLNPARERDLADKLLLARQQLAQRLSAEKLDDLVAPFDPLAYNAHATLADNLLFATPEGQQFQGANLADNPVITELLEKSNLTQDLGQMGLSIAKTMVELFADLPPGHPFFDQFSFIAADDLPLFKQTVQRAEKGGLDALDKDERLKLLALTFNYIEARHRLGLVETALQEKIVAARRLLAERIEKGEVKGLVPYDPAAYSAAASVLDNVLFGRLAYGKAQAEETVSRLVSEILADMGLKPAILAHGLDYNVGVGGKRLSAAQRQKLGLARALLKKPDILLVNDALAVLDGAAQARILERILAARLGKAVVWALTRASGAKAFHRVAVLEKGRIVGEGDYAELDKPGSPLARLVAAG